MANTASPSLSQALGRAAKVLRLLEQAGMTDDDFQDIINDNALRHQFVEAWRSISISSAPVAEVPEKPHPAQLERFLRAMTGMSSEWNQTPFREVVFGRLLAGYQKPGVLKGLVDENVKQARDQAVLVHRFGLATGETLTLAKVGELFRISGGRVSDLETRAIRQVRFRFERQFQMILDKYVAELIASGQHSVEELDDSNGFGKHSIWLMNEDIYTIEQLVELTEEELLHVMRHHHGAVEDIKEQLAARGLKLKDG